METNKNPMRPFRLSVGDDGFLAPRSFIIAVELSGVAKVMGTARDLDEHTPAVVASAVAASTGAIAGQGQTLFGGGEIEGRTGAANGAIRGERTAEPLDEKGAEGSPRGPTRD